MASLAPALGLWFAWRMTRRAKTSVKYTLGIFLFLLATATMFALGVGIVLLDEHLIHGGLP